MAQKELIDLSPVYLWDSSQKVLLPLLRVTEMSILRSTAIPD